MKYICDHCGAEIDDTMPRCPYCDAMLAKGAEAEDMEKLYDIHENLEELKEIPAEVVKEEFKYQGRRIKKVVLIAVLITAALAAYLFVQEKQYERDNTADYLWSRENLPAMTELYEQGEWEELAILFELALKEDRPVWNWEYFDEYSEWWEEYYEMR